MYSTKVPETNSFGPQLFRAAYYANILKYFLISNRRIQCLSLNQSNSRIFKQVSEKNVSTGFREAFKSKAMLKQATVMLSVCHNITVKSAIYMVSPTNYVVYIFFLMY